MSYYLIGIGGTGAKCLEAFVHLCGAGLLEEAQPVKVVFEGQTAVRTTSENDDWSTDLQTYKKFGVAVFTNPSICSYQNTALKK